MKTEQEPMILDGDHENPKSIEKTLPLDFEIAIRTTTLASWIAAVKYLYDHGYYWNDHENVLVINSHFWSDYKEDTCLIICNHALFFASYTYCVEENMNILDIDDMYCRIP